MTATGTEPMIKNVPGKTTGLHILIAEDYEDAAESMAILLRLCGHEVAIARNGPSALAKARAEKPDVVLLDIGLPLMSGYDVARELSGRRPEKTPLLIAVTGWGREEDRRCSHEAGIDLHLLKPVDPVQLQCILDRFQRVITGTRAENEKDLPGTPQAGAINDPRGGVVVHGRGETPGHGFLDTV
jgi:two-component system, OmpR family, response regulator